MAHTRRLEDAGGLVKPSEYDDIYRSVMYYRVMGSVSVRSLAIVALLVTGLSPSRLLAAEDDREPATDPAAAEKATGEAAGSGAAGSGALLAPAIDPFADKTVLQAHKLRGLTAEVAGLVLRGQPGGDIAFEALATPLRGDGALSDVALFIEIDGATFLESNQSPTARVEIYAYALGPDQQIAGYLAEAFAVDIHKLGEAIWQGGLKYYGHLELPPGDYQLRLVVRLFQSGTAALRAMELHVPAFEDLRQAFLTPPIFTPPPARDAWLPVREWQPTDYPFVIDERAISPAVRPVLVAGRPAQAYLFASGPPVGALQGRLQLLQRGVPVAGTMLQIRRLESDGRLQAFEILFDSPPVEPGIYALRVELADGPMTTPTPVVVLQASTRDRSLLWTDLRGQMSRAPAAGQTTAAVVAPDADREIGRAARREDDTRIRGLAASYREALVALGQGRHSAARSALLDLESSVLTDSTLQSLRTAQLLVAEQLAARDVESLIPLLVLHDDLYQIYRKRKLFSLGSNSRGLVELYAELYAERGGTQGSRIVAARALASLAGHLQQANLPANSRRLYRRALEHDPQSLPALLGLATSYERYAEYPLAIETLEQLAVAHPDFGEGLLRLAINLDRLGVRPRARDLITRVIELDSPDWIRSLAYQRLARALVDTGELDQAALLLERSVGEIADQHGSIYLLAHIYDRRREAQRAWELLNGNEPSSNGNGTERKRYDSWPEASLATIRKKLSEAAEVRAPLIAEILQPVQEQR